MSEFIQRPESELEISLKRQLEELKQQYEAAAKPIREALAKEQERICPTSNIIGDTAGFSSPQIMGSEIRKAW